MNAGRTGLTRRQFLGTASAAAATALGRSPRAVARDPAKRSQGRTVLSFYCDDTNPYVAGAKPFEVFLDYCAEHRLAGESSTILGMGGHSMCRKPNEEEQAFLHQVARAWKCGIGTHMELMTHRGLFDFDANRERTGAGHEGLWLYEPEVRVEQYQRYFGSIIAEGARAGVKFTGLTWPGCGCDVCTRRYAELRRRTQGAQPCHVDRLAQSGQRGEVPWPHRALFLRLQRDRLRHPSQGGRRRACRLRPDAQRQGLFWHLGEQPVRVDPDYYISANGKSGIVVRHVEAHAPYCLWYSHWQGLNPAKGVGWRAFRTVVERIGKHLRDRVVWMRPSEITDRYHAAGGWGFIDPDSAPARNVP